MDSLNGHSLYTSKSALCGCVHFGQGQMSCYHYLKPLFLEAIIHLHVPGTQDDQEVNLVRERSKVRPFAPNIILQDRTFVHSAVSKAKIDG